MDVQSQPGKSGKSGNITERQDDRLPFDLKEASTPGTENGMMINSSFCWLQFEAPVDNLYSVKPNDIREARRRKEQQHLFMQARR